MTEHEFFTHVTAAVIWGIPLPLTALGQGLIDVGVFSPRRNPESSTVRGHAVHTKLARVQDHPVTGLRVASPASTWAMLGAVLSDPYDLVAAGDAVVRSPIHRDDPMALASPDQLHAVVAAGRRRGVIALREALARVRTGSASRPETWTRLTVVDAGLPEPIANFDVWDDETWLARVDLAYPDLKIAIEYEGRHHLHDVAQWTADIARYERLVQAGWQVIRVTHDEVFVEPRLLVARVRRAIARASR